MAFFDSVSKKISQAGQDALQKTKDMADIAKFNSSISEEEKRLNNNYYQIGKLYAQMYSDNFEDCFSTYMIAIKESLEKIEQYKNELQKLRDVAKCSNCGAEVPKSAQYCNSCGHVMPRVVAQPANTVKCGNCGNFVDKEMRFCTSCGFPMTQSAPANAPVQETAFKVEIKASCPVCGADVDDDAIFCAECGTKIK